MKASAILEDLKRLYKGGVGRCGWGGDAGEKTVRWWSRRYNITEREVLDAIALNLAHGYLKSDYDWQFADWVANKVLFTGMTDFGLDGGPVENREPWWGVYLAFDDSEVSDDPVERARENLADLGLKDLD